MRGAAALLLLSCSCLAGGAGAPDGGPLVDFTIHGLQFHVSSGAAVTSSAGALTLYLSDQPNACDAIRNLPARTAIAFSLRVAAQADGTTRATVVPRKAAPAAGEAVGGLSQTTGTTGNASIDANDGAVAWIARADGSVFISTVDVGFAGTADRLTTGQLTLARCP